MGGEPIGSDNTDPRTAKFYYVYGSYPRGVVGAREQMIALFERDWDKNGSALLKFSAPCGTKPPPKHVVLSWIRAGINDIACPCGNANHWLLKIEERNPMPQEIPVTHVDRGKGE